MVVSVVVHTGNRDVCMFLGTGMLSVFVVVIRLF